MRGWLTTILRGIALFFTSTIPSMIAAIITGLWTFFTLSTVITALPGYLPSAQRLIAKGWPSWAFVGAPYGWLAAELTSFMRAFGAEFEIYTRRVVRQINRDIPETRLSPAELVNASVQSVLPDATVKDLLLEEGYTAAVAQNLIDIAGQPIAPNQALDLFNRWRGGTAKPGRTYDEGWVKQALSESALKNKYTDAIVDLADQLLGASDYIRFAVRDAFDDAVAARDRTDEDFPAVLGPLLRSLGYRQEDAKAAWRAHWDMPSPGQAYDMLHRGLLTQQELQDYLRQADYAPRWRPLLEAISYDPITRTDAKRAYKLKVNGFDEAKLLQAYKNLGYNDADAAMLVEFTKQDVGEEARQERELLTGPIRTQALNMYRARRITEAELRKTLTDLGYGAPVIDKYVAEIQFSRDVDHREEIAAALKSAYVKGLRTRDDTRTLLINGGWPESAVEQVLEPWDLLREATELAPHKQATRDLTQSQIIAAYADHLIDRTEAFNQVKALGYDDTETETLLALQDYKTTQDELKTRTENVHLNFLRFAYTEASASTALAELGLPTVRIRNLVMQWAREREKATPDFQIATLEQMVKQKVMDEETAGRYLEAQGWTPEQRFYLLNFWLGRRLAAEAKAAGK